MPAPEQATRTNVDAEPHATTGVGSVATLTAVPPTVTERYMLGDEIDRGGMGIIYRATDTVLGREVVVKVLQEKNGTTSGAARRFADEARITGQLQHPSIPPVHDLGTLPDGRPFLAMKLIKGRTLEHLLKTRPDSSTDRGRFVAVFEQVCQALAYAHLHDVIHRDLKPANVMVGSFGEVQVMDWGLAKVLGAVPSPASLTEAPNEATRAWTQISPRPDLGSHTQAGSLLGTPAFASPEQALGEIDRVDRRADVFGLGAILAVILTGKPPYVGETAESIRVMAVRGKLDDCFARLATCGAEPELVVLCKRCLAFEPADRPANAGEVAKAVVELRAAADERARRAELDRVRVEGEQAMAEARAAERRKRRQLWFGAAAVLALAVVGGLTAVVAVQQRANTELAAEQAKVEARFKMAADSIKLFHTVVSEDNLLKNEGFKPLRTKLLKEAAGFYAELEKLLAGQTDAKSRKTLAAGYFEFGDLTAKIASQSEALAVHRKALAIRLELAASPGTDVETRLDVARSLEAVGEQLGATGDTEAALAAFEEQRDLALRLAEEDPTEAVRAVLGRSYHKSGLLLSKTGKPAEALEAYKKARAIRQELTEANPAVAEFQRGLAWTHNNIGGLLMEGGKPAEALAALEQALAIWQKLAKGNPAVSDYQAGLAMIHNNIALFQSGNGKPEEALESYKEALAIWQKLAEANSAVTEFQRGLALCYLNIGRLHASQKRFIDAFDNLDRSLNLYQKRLDEHSDETETLSGVGWSYAYRGWARVRAGHSAEAASDLRQAVKLWAKHPSLMIDARFERCRALSLLAGLGGDAKSGVTLEEARTFADQSVAALVALIKTGWARPSELKEPEFDALRGRADFQKLVAAVEAKVKQLPQTALTPREKQ